MSSVSTFVGLTLRLIRSSAHPLIIHSMPCTLDSAVYVAEREPVKAAADGSDDGDNDIDEVTKLRRGGGLSSPPLYPQLGTGRWERQSSSSSSSSCSSSSGSSSSSSSSGADPSAAGVGAGVETLLLVRGRPGTQMEQQHQQGGTGSSGGNDNQRGTDGSESSHIRHWMRQGRWVGVTCVYVWCG